MASSLARVVIDTNTLLRGIVSDASAAGKVRRAAETRQVIPLMSKAVLDEYRAVLSRPIIRNRFPAITVQRIEYVIQRMKFVGDYIRKPHVHFDFPRDPLDEKFIELAIGMDATHLITSDNDLLSLPRGRDDASKRFRQRLPDIEVIDARGFVLRYGL